MDTISLYDALKWYKDDLTAAASICADDVSAMPQFCSQLQELAVTTIPIHLVIYFSKGDVGDIWTILTPDCWIVGRSTICAMLAA